MYYIINIIDKKGNFIKEIKFDRVGVFKYSAEEGTSCYQLGDPVPLKTKIKREKELMMAQQKISLDKNREFLGKTIRVIVDRHEGSKNNGYFLGRSMREAPEVDGSIIIKPPFGGISTGKFYDVKIERFSEYDLFGKLIENRG